MASPFNWSAYASGDPTSILTTQLNSLANSAANVLSTSNTGLTAGGYIYADMEFVSGGAITPVAGAFVEVWLLRSIDGTNYEDGSSTAAPGRAADAVIPVRSASTITPRAGIPGVILPVSTFAAIARNQTGVTLAASGNIVRYSRYTEQY